jgi:hypothetical protein
MRHNFSGFGIQPAMGGYVQFPHFAPNIVVIGFRDIAQIDLGGRTSAELETVHVSIRRQFVTFGEARNAGFIKNGRYIID